MWRSAQARARGSVAGTHAIGGRGDVSQFAVQALDALGDGNADVCVAAVAVAATVRGSMPSRAARRETGQPRAARPVNCPALHGGYASQLTESGRRPRARPVHSAPACLPRAGCGADIREGTSLQMNVMRVDAPIYDRLVRERGDVPTEVRRTAERTWREVEGTMDFRLVRAPESYRRG